jgi:hypothetical protein
MLLRPGALPISEQILLDLFFPPVGACIWWLMARGWAVTVQGGPPSETTKKLQRWLFWALLASAYLLMFGITVYRWLT